MRTAARLGVFGLGLAAAFTGAWGVGQAIGEPPPEPVAEHDEDPSHPEPALDHDDDGSAVTDDHGQDAPTTDGTDADGHAAHGAAAPPGGLQISQDGYTFHLVDTPTTAGTEATLAFHIIGPDGHPVTEFDIEHEKRLHLIVANRSLTEFQHVHPEMADDGLWTLPITLDAGGAYRAFADFSPSGGDPLTLGADLLVLGSANPGPMPAEAPTSTVDGYEVSLDGRMASGEEDTLSFTVTRDGSPVELEPYLGAYGHLVVLRAGDLAYLHAHPHGDEPQPGQTGGPSVGFATTAPSIGTYRLFLDFQVDGVVHTASFTVDVGTGHDH